MDRSDDSLAAGVEIFDTHCHIQEIVGPESEHTRQKWHKGGVADPDTVIADARHAGVTRMVCVGCDVDDSALAVDFVQSRDNLWASIGIHPHEAQRYVDDPEALQRFRELATQPKVVAVGEFGLDYFYEHSPKAAQLKILRFQLQLALEHALPMIFHIREAFDDFWPVFDEYAAQAKQKGTDFRGVVHSFTASSAVLEQALSRGLYIGLNGIMTFTKDTTQLAAAKAVPLDRMVIETDAPYLTPSPYRGNICEPKHARTTVAFVAQLQDVQPEALAARTTENACRLFNLGR